MNKTATPHAPGVYIDMQELTRRNEIFAYAHERGIGWQQAIIQLVNQALSDGPNPQYAALRSCAEVNGITEDQAYKLIWGDA